jgi:beta-xylosidase
VYCRIVHLQPVEWHDDWPLMGVDQDGNGIGEPVTRHSVPVVTRFNGTKVPQTTDAFDGQQLGLQWQWSANHNENWYSLTARRGWLRLLPLTVPEVNLSETPNLLLQKLPAQSFRVDPHVELASGRPGEEAGLVLQGRQYGALALRRTAASFQVVFRKDGHDTVRQEVSSGSMDLRLDFEPGGLCSFAFRIHGGSFKPIPERVQATPGVWIGAKVGIDAIAASAAERRGHADFDHFTFSPLHPAN